GIFGEFTVIIPRWHPVLSVFGEALDPLFELALIEQTCLIVEEVFDFRTGNFLGHKCLRHGDLSLYRRLGQISSGDERRRERRERRGAPAPDAAFSAAAASAASFFAAAASANSRDASDAAFASTRSLLTDASILTAWRMTSSQYPCWIGYRPSSSV